MLDRRDASVQNYMDARIRVSLNRAAQDLDVGRGGILDDHAYRGVDVDDDDA